MESQISAYDCSKALHRQTGLPRKKNPNNFPGKLVKKVTIFLERNELKQTREKNIKKKGLASRSGDPRKTHVTQTFFFLLN